MKNIGNLFVRLFVSSLLTFRYFSIIVSLFGAGAAHFFRLRLRANRFGGSGSGSTKMCRLRLRIPGLDPCQWIIVLVSTTLFESHRAIRYVNTLMFLTMPTVTSQCILYPLCRVVLDSDFSG